MRMSRITYPLIYNWLLLGIFLLQHNVCIGSTDSVKVSYKTVDTTDLYLRIYYPTHFDATKKYPTMVFFFGGGWYKGSYRHLKPHSEYFSTLGMITILADYRVSEIHGTTPMESLKDARSAMRFIKSNAAKYSIDQENITAAGGSAGGHLAAALAMSVGMDESEDDLLVDPAPKALVLFNPVLDNGPEGFGYERVKDYYKNFSPYYNVRENLPPTIIFIGTADHLIPLETILAFQQKMVAFGNTCKVVKYEGQDHGFFNYENKAFYDDTINRTVVFLKEQNIIN